MTIVAVPCPAGKACNVIEEGMGRCEVSSTGSCDCVPMPVTPPPTATPQCGGSECSGTCVIELPCPPGGPCPGAVALGQCGLGSDGSCQCMLGAGATPTPACATDSDCNDNNVCTSDHCVNGVCEIVCICLNAAGESCCSGPASLCVAACGADAAGSCGGSCPVGANCQASPSSNATCSCVSGPGGPCGGNIYAQPPVCAPGLVCRQALPDVVGFCEKPNCVPLFASGCSDTSDCCQPCENGTHAPCGVCLNGTCEGAP